MFKLTALHKIADIISEDENVVGFGKSSKIKNKTTDENEEGNNFIIIL